MSLHKYYEILGLPTSATKNDIRKQYRKLAMRWHPDKNPSARAKEQFMIITEAYEILMGRADAPVKRRVDDKHEKERAHKERIMAARKRYQEQLEKERIENERYFRGLISGPKWRLIKIASIIGPVLAFLILLDLFLPTHYTDDRITHYARDVYYGADRSEVSLVLTKSEREYWIGDMNYSLYAEYPEVLIQKTWIFHQPINIISLQKVKYSFYPVHFTFYSFSFFMIVVFTLPLLVRKFKKRTVLFTVAYHLSLYLTNFMILLFLFRNDHWVHLLTLGFL